MCAKGYLNNKGHWSWLLLEVSEPLYTFSKNFFLWTPLLSRASRHILATTIGVGQHGSLEIRAVFVGHLQYSWKVGIQLSGHHGIRSTQACRQRSSRNALLGELWNGRSALYVGYCGALSFFILPSKLGSGLFWGEFLQNLHYNSSIITIQMSSNVTD